MTELSARLAQLATEQSRPDLADLDTRSTAELVELMTAEDADVVRAVQAAAPSLTAAVDLVVDRLGRGGRLIYAGAGTAGRLAVLDAAELLPTFGVGAAQVPALLAGGSGAMLAAVEGAEDDEDAGRRDLGALRPGPDDVVLAVSASGRTPYALAVLETGRAAGAATVSIANNADSPLAAAADIAIDLLTGPEVVAGSTRLKAGTAQKLALNTLSTAAMIRLGKVHRNLMVDVRTTNEKLRLRGIRIVAEATGARDDEVTAALEQAGGHAKTAIVMLLAGVEAMEAGRRLADAGGRVRDAVGTPGR